MLTRKLTKYFVVVMTFLLATLIEELALEFLIPDFNNYKNPYVATLVGMGLVVIIYYPAFLFIDNVASKLTKQYLKASKKVISKKSIYGLLVGMIVALVVLYFIFLELWFHINVLELLA